jgi:L-serine dehydratase
LERRAKRYFKKSDTSPRYVRRINRIFSYALACAEENASGGRVVTAPTCGSSGVLPAALRISKEIYEMNDIPLLRALATAGLFGTLAKTNASIS